MVSSLYDRVIASSVQRLAAAVPADTCGGDDDDSQETALKIAVGVMTFLFAISLGALCYFYFFAVPKSKYMLAGDEEEKSALQHSLVISS